MYILENCQNCGQAFETQDTGLNSYKPSNPPVHGPITIQLGHIVCTPCARLPTLTPATSMSRCGTCHVPYTKRDIYTLRILPTTDLPPTLPPTTPNTAFIDPKRRQSGLNRRASQSLLDLGSASHVATHNTNRSDARERALLDRIQHLESLVTLRECQVKQWKSQVDKNARTLLGYLREIKELKNEVLSWWRKYQTKDVEYQALRETIARQPLPNGPIRSSPHVPLERTTTEELPLHRKGRHAKPPDGIRIVSYHEYPKKSLSPLFRQQEPPITPVAVPPPYGA